MQSVSKLYTTLLSDPQCRKEHQVTIAGTVYGGSGYVTCETAHPLFAQDTISVGGTCAAEIDLVIRDPQDIPKAALMHLDTRVTANGQASEWIPKGDYHVDTRQQDNASNTLTIHGFDRMIETEQPFKLNDRWTWPMPDDEVVQHICEQCSMELDERTVIRHDYTMSMPVNATCRDILSWIGAAHGGNWIMTDAGKLRLIRLRDAVETSILVEEYGRFIQFGDTLIQIGPMDTKNINADSLKDNTNVGRRAAQITVSLKHKPVTKVVVSTSDETGFEAGTDEGETIYAYCPDGTQQMANDLLAYLGGYEYQPMQATDALLDPAAELGDGVTIENVYAILANVDITHDALYSADIGAPTQHETESEYGQFEGPATKEFKRQVREVGISIGKSLDALTVTVNDIDGRTTTIETTIDGITVTGEGGTTYIKPDSIETGSITGDKIKAGSINGDRIEAGTITGNEIKAGSIGTDELNSKYLNIGDGKFVVDDGNITISGCDITLKDYSISGMKLETDAVDNRCIGKDAVKSDQIYNGAVTAKKINARGLRIGPSDNDIQFEVTEEGQVNIKGNVKIAGSISWENVTGTDGIEKDISTAKTDAGNAKTAAEGAAGDVKKLANGTFTQPGVDVETTFISNKQIRSAEILGAKIRGGEFTNLDGSGLFVVRAVQLPDGSSSVAFQIGRDANNPDIQLMQGATSSVFRSKYIYISGNEQRSYISIGPYSGVGNPILDFKVSQKYVKVGGNKWDFSNVEVVGLTAKFG